jgi:hypothetical protein
LLAILKTLQVHRFEVGLPEEFDRPSSQGFLDRSWSGVTNRLGGRVGIEDSVRHTVAFIGYATDDPSKGGIDCISTAFFPPTRGFPSCDYKPRAYRAGSMPTYPLMSAYQTLPSGSTARL